MSGVLFAGGRWIAAAMAVMAAAAVVLVTQDAAACGGCFAPAGPTGDAAILQSAERVLFVRDAKTDTTLVWVEVRYSGPAKDFAWVIPVPAKPKVGVGSSFLFNRLDLATGPRFERTFSAAAENCRQLVKTQTVTETGEPASTSDVAKVDSVQADAYGDSGGCGGDFGGSTNAYGSTFAGQDPVAGDSSPGRSLGSGQRVYSDGNGRNEQSTVTIVEHEQIGPYDYVVLDGSKASELAGWLKSNGYAVPEAAHAIIKSHVDKGDMFLAVKLKSGAGAHEIRPITLEMKGVESCVPLRLTSIAAVQDTSVVVYLAGAGRAIPKNHLHVVLNPLKLFLANGAPNYANVLSQALDEASGRAFVTEFSGAMSEVSVPESYTFERFAIGGQVYAAGDADRTDWFDATSLAKTQTAREVVNALRDKPFALDRDAIAIIEKHTGILALAEKNNTMTNKLQPGFVWGQLLGSNPQFVSGL